MAGKKQGKVTDLRKLPKDKRPRPTTGQHAKERPLPYDDLNDDERAVVKALNGRNGKRLVRSVEFLADLFDDDDPKLRVRNALRRLVSCGWVDREARGKYQVSERGRKRLERA